MMSGHETCTKHDQVEKDVKSLGRYMLFVAVMLIGLVLGSYLNTSSAMDEVNVMKIRQAEINADLRYMREKLDEIATKLDRVTR